jgi:hypothetical protein
MKRFARIASGLLVLFVAYIAGNVCAKVAARVHHNVMANDPTMLFGIYRMDGWHGYVIPCVVGLIALAFCVTGLYLVVSKGKSLA